MHITRAVDLAESFQSNKLRTIDLRTLIRSDVIAVIVFILHFLHDVSNLHPSGLISLHFEDGMSLLTETVLHCL